MNSEICHSFSPDDELIPQLLRSSTSLSFREILLNSHQDMREIPNAEIVSEKRKSGSDKYDN